MHEIIDFGQEGGAMVESTYNTMALTITREKIEIYWDVPMLVDMLGIQLPFARKPYNFAECSGAYCGVMVTHTKTMLLSEYVSFVRNLNKPYAWLNGRGGIFQRALDPSDTAWVPQPKTRDYRLCVEVVCPGMPMLYIDPQGSDCARYLARLG